MPARVVLRAPALARAYTVVFGVVWCGFVALGLVAAIGAGSPGAVIPLIMLGFGAAFMTRLFIMIVVADETGLLVRNLYRTRHFGWSQVEDFRIGASTGFRRRKSIYVLLRDGEIFPLEVTDPQFYGASAKLPSHLDRLRSWLPQYS
jgi:PH (Pleckstrin Homology) domain-containing protein